MMNRKNVCEIFEFAHTSKSVGANNYSPLRHIQSFIFITMRKSISNRDNHSDRIQRRVVARRDSTTNTKS